MQLHQPEMFNFLVIEYTVNGGLETKLPAVGGRREETESLALSDFGDVIPK